VYLSIDGSIPEKFEEDIELIKSCNDNPDHKDRRRLLWGSRTIGLYAPASLVEDYLQELMTMGNNLFRQLVDGSWVTELVLQEIFFLYKRKIGQNIYNFFFSNIQYIQKETKVFDSHIMFVLYDFLNPKRIMNFIPDSNGKEKKDIFEEVERFSGWMGSLTIDKNPIVICPIRDEVDLIKPFIDWHKKLGFSNFIFLNNNSKDGTYEELLRHPVNFFNSNINFFSLAIYIRTLINQYRDRILYIADIDEFLMLKEDVTSFMDRWGKPVAPTTIMDCFGDKSVGETRFSGVKTGEELFERAPFVHKMETADKSKIWVRFELNKKLMNIPNKTLKAKYNLIRLRDEDKLCYSYSLQGCPPVEGMYFPQGYPGVPVFHFKFSREYIDKELMRDKNFEERKTSYVDPEYIDTKPMDEYVEILRKHKFMDRPENCLHYKDFLTKRMRGFLQ
jgi:hypothetical protein